MQLVDKAKFLARFGRFQRDNWCKLSRFWLGFAKIELMVLCRMSRLSQEQADVCRGVEQKVKCLARFWEVSKRQLVGNSSSWFGVGRFQRDNLWFSKERADVW